MRNFDCYQNHRPWMTPYSAVCSTIGYYSNS